MVWGFEVAWGLALVPVHPTEAVWGAVVVGGWVPGWEAGCWSSGACLGSAAAAVVAAVVAAAAAEAVMGFGRLALGMCLCQESSVLQGGQEVGFLVWGVRGQVSSQPDAECAGWDRLHCEVCLLRADGSCHLSEPGLGPWSSGCCSFLLQGQLQTRSLWVLEDCCHLGSAPAPICP